MSYILDALRRAQAERERGQVPGLEARTLVATPPPQPQRRASLLWLGGGLALAVLALAAGLTLRSGPPTAPGPEAVTTVGAAGGARPASASMPAPALTTAPGSALQASPAVVVVSAPPAPSAPIALPAPPAPFAPAAGPPQGPAPALLPPVMTAQPPPAAAASSPRPVQLAQLNPDQRRELPALALGGAIWSDNAASRFVIVNGQVLREGDVAAPGVLLERIGPKAVWLRWRDWRIEVPI